MVKALKNKLSISKSIAALLCIIAVTISFNIYLSYKDLYQSNNLPKDSIIYIAAAKASSKNSTRLTNNNPLAETDALTKIESEVGPSKDAIEQKIFINILMLFLSFISLASVHNFIINTEENQEPNSKNLFKAVVNKNPSKNTFSPYI